MERFASPPPLHLLVLTSALFGLAACTENAPANAPEADKTRVSKLRTKDVLPLTDRTVGSFRARSDFEEGSFVLEYYRPSETVAHLVIAGRTDRLVVSEEEVKKTDGSVVLRDPLEVGRTFRGAFGEVAIVRVDVQVTVPAGRFERCVVTRETSKVVPKSAETTYCEGVGLVRLVVEAGAERLENELLSYGPRVDLVPGP